jgi:hypothetical protein
MDFSLLSFFFGMWFHWTITTNENERIEEIISKAAIGIFLLGLAV